jgi:hypothetical protein
VRAVGGRRGRLSAARVSPPGDHRLLVDQSHVHRRPGGKPTPLRDLPVQALDHLADLLLGPQVLDGRGQPFDLLAQPQRGGQQFVAGHAFAAQVVLQPRVGPAAAGERLARAGQVIEGTPLSRLADLLVDPRGEADFPWFALCHQFPC